MPKIRESGEVSQTKKSILKKISIYRIIGRLFLISYLIVLFAVIYFHFNYADKVLPNVYLNGVPVGGKTVSELSAIVDQQTSADISATIKVKDYSRHISQEDITFVYLKKATIKKVFLVGRESNYIESFKQKFLSLFDRHDITYEYSYDEDQLKILTTIVRIEALKPFEEPHFQLSGDEIVLVEGKSGETFDEGLAKNLILNRFTTLNSGDVDVEIIALKPTLRLLDIERLKPALKEYIDAKFVFKFEEKIWPFLPNDILMIFKPIKKNTGSEFLIDDQVIIDRLNVIADEINRNPRAQVLEVKDGRAIKFESSLTGRALNVEKTLELTKNNLLEKKSEILLIVDESKAPQVKNDFEIVDVLGIGKSSFRGSDSGRVKNIQNAVAKIDGVIVAPGEVFSFLKSVGPVTRENGFGPAKVISGGRTVLGDGGGVCQVSTTVFRSALNSGLPILERNAHSYRVGYYEQGSAPGIDATIYYPSVDFQFKNDTNSYILVDADLDVKKMTLDFIIYGKSDGRKVEVSTPQITNKKAAPATIYMDDPTLPKGTRKQLEYSVGGATVVFNRTVTRGDEILATDSFKSVYRAWGAVIAVGTK
jgi:vancomycin resistance protein YoaR